MMIALEKLKGTQKEVFYMRLVTIQNNLDELVQRFYGYFLKTDAATLFKNIDIEKQ